VSIFLSLGLREKYATSDPEITAEKNKRTITTVKPIIIPGEKETNLMAEITSNDDKNKTASKVTYPVLNELKG
jgi:hypothetical protein